MRMRAAVLEEFGEPLAVQEVELAEPREGEVLSLIHISSPRDGLLSRMPSSA